MKLPGWLWAWVRAYLDWIVTCTGFACGVLYLATGWVPFMVVAAAVSAAVLAGLWAGKERLLRVWNRVPWVRKVRRRAQWSDGHPSVRAAKRREIQMLDQWWDLPAAEDVRKEQQ